MLKVARDSQMVAKDEGDINKYDATDKQKIIANLKVKQLSTKLLLQNRDSEILTLQT